MTADTVQLVVERERELEARIAAERERLKRSLEEHAASLERHRASRIKVRENLYDRQRAALEDELEEARASAVKDAKRELARLERSEDELISITQHVLEGFSWRPSPSSK